MVSDHGADAQHLETQPSLLLTWEESSQGDPNRSEQDQSQRLTLEPRGQDCVVLGVGQRFLSAGRSKLTQRPHVHGQLILSTDEARVCAGNGHPRA